MYRYLIRNRRIYVFVLVAIIAALLGTGFSFVLSRMLDMAQSGSNEQLLAMLLFAVGYVLITVMFEYLFSFLKYLILKETKLELKDDILHSILNKSINEFERQNSSFYLNEMTTKNDMIVELYFKNLLGIPYFIFSFVSAVVACIYLNWVMLIVMFVFSLLTVFVTNKAGKNIEKTSKVFSDILPEYTQKVKDYFEGIKVIKVFKSESLIEKEHLNINVRLENARLQNVKSMMLANYSGEIVGLISTVFVTAIAAALALNGYITIGAVLAFSQLMGKIVSPISVFVDMRSQLKTVKPVLVELNEIIGDRNESIETDYVSDFGSSIKFDHVSFSYTDEQDQIIDNCSFEINGNSKVLISGKSGSGKSTIIALLLKFYEGYKGTILIGGKDLRTVPYEKLYSKIGYLSQTPFIFEDTIRNNVSLFNSSISDVEIISVLEKVGLKPLLDSLPNGLETPLKDLGNNLSGGEKQRISLARVMLLDKEILILDEFETGLDTETKEIIENTILSLKNKIIITISHDISDDHKRKYDIIYTIKDGKMVA